MAVNDRQREALLGLSKKLAALGPDDFDYVKVHGVSHQTWNELEQTGLVETFLATGYGDMVFYRLTSAGASELSPEEAP